jgi:hypothetical protein
MPKEIPRQTPSEGAMGGYRLDFIFLDRKAVRPDVDGKPAPVEITSRPGGREMSASKKYQEKRVLRFP